MKLKEYVEKYVKMTDEVDISVLNEHHRNQYLIWDEQSMDKIRHLLDYEIKRIESNKLFDTSDWEEVSHVIYLKSKKQKPTFDDLKPIFTNEENDSQYLENMQEDIINKPNHYNLGNIETREYILDVLHHNDNLEVIDGYYLGNILKYLSVRLGNKDSKLQDMKKAQNYLDKWIKEYEEPKFHPAEYIADFAVDEKTAKKLEDATGVSAETWLNLQRRYDE